MANYGDDIVQYKVGVAKQGDEIVQYEVGVAKYGKKVTEQRVVNMEMWLSMKMVWLSIKKGWLRGMNEMAYVVSDG